MSPSKSAGIRLVLAGVVVGCGGAGTHEPLSPEAAGVRYTTSQEPAAVCKRIGGARGIGHDVSEKVAERRAVDAGREQAAKLGGNVIVLVDKQRGTRDGPDGPEAEIVELFDVFSCKDARGATAK